MGRYWLTGLAVPLIAMTACSAGSGRGDVGDSRGESRQQPTMPPKRSDVPAAAARPLTNRVPRSVVDVCARVAARASRQGTTRTVFCPPLVPDVDVSVEAAGGLLSYSRFEEGYMIGFWSPEVRWADRFGGHWTVSVGEAQAQRVYVYPPNRPPPPPPQISKTVLRGVTVTVYRVSAEVPGFYSGHVVFEWRVGKTTFHLTMHGHQFEREARLMAAALIAEVRSCATETARQTRRKACRLVFGRGNI